MAQDDKAQQNRAPSAAGNGAARLTKEQVAALVAAARERGVTELSNAQIAAVLDAAQRRAQTETVTREEILRALENAQKQAREQRARAEAARATVPARDAQGRGMPRQAARGPLLPLSGDAALPQAAAKPQQQAAQSLVRSAFEAKPKAERPETAQSGAQRQPKAERRLTRQRVEQILAEARRRGVTRLAPAQTAAVLEEAERRAQTHRVSKEEILCALAAAQEGKPWPEPQSSATLPPSTPGQKSGGAAEAARGPEGRAPQSKQPAQTQPVQPQPAQPQPARRGRKRSARRLDTTMTVSLNQIAMVMQRGANDAARIQASQANALPMRLVYNAIGQLLYRMGLQTEYAALRLWRGVRTGAHLFGKGLVVLLRAVFLPLWQMLAGIGRDLSAPLVHVAVGLHNMGTAVRQARRDGRSTWQTARAYLHAGVMRYKHVGIAALSYLLPLAAAGVFALTAWTLLGRAYSLSVTCDGTMLGFVESESVWEDAQNLVKSRIKAADEGQEFAVSPVFHITQVDVAARSTASQLADKLVSASTDQIQQATGLYVDGALVGVVTDGRSVQQILDNALASGTEAGNPNVRVEFVHQMTQVDGLYFNASITSLAQLESTLETNNDLQLKRIETMTYQEVLPFETQEQESDKYYEGTQRVQQKGVDGLQEVTADVVTVDGVEVERTVLSSAVLKEATPKIVLVGTKSYSSSIAGTVTGSGAYIWPVPDYSYITTRFGQGGHRGIDICGPYGTPIYACDAGTVIESGWHWSWGYYIKIDHGNGMATLYAHCSSLLVPAGTNVSRGQVIALMGSTGNSSGNHCHLETYVNNGLVNPMSYFSGVG